jgi:hypothetical protein
MTTSAIPTSSFAAGAAPTITSRKNVLSGEADTAAIVLLFLSP